MTEKGRQVRKLAAIMFTDMVGYSALTQRNEPLALELLEEHRQLLRSVFLLHNGKEVETAGDAFFVEFVSALDATQCAIAIQTKLFQRNASVGPERHIRLRIGLHLGDVVHHGKHVHGDGVNIAARVESCAAPGSICISEDVARQVENKIEMRLIQLAKQQLKNIQLPVTIYRIEMPWEKTHSSGRHGFAVGLKSTRMLLYALFAAAAVALIAYSLNRLFTRLPANSNSIAVLPFKNLSEDKDNEYFSDGITGEIIGQLCKIAGLNVISQTSVMQYKGEEKQNLRDIASALNVGTVLEGRVQRAANRVHISVALINAANDHHLWQETYDEEMTVSSIFSIQTSVAQRIAKTLETQILPAEKERIGKGNTNNFEAYDLYLKGRYYWNKRLPASLNKGIQCFNQAIEKDSNYALAYAGLADSYTILGNFNLDPPHLAYPKAEAAARRALSLDSNLADAHASLGFAKLNYDWDWPAAEKELQRAIAIDPNSATARSWYAFLLTVMGRFDEVTPFRDKAMELGPQSPVINTDVGLTLYFARKYDAAIERFKNALETDPTFGLAYVPMGGAYVQKKMYKEAIEAYQTFTAGLAFAHLSHPIPVAAIGHVFAVSGRTREAHDYLELVEEMSASQYVAPYWRAVLYIGLGKKEQAITWLEKAYENRDGSMVFLRVDPVFDSIRADARFVALLKRMKLD